MACFGLFPDDKDYASSTTVFGLRFSVGFYIFDLLLDLVTAFTYYNDKECYAAFATVSVALVSSLITLAISCFLCTQDQNESSSSFWNKMKMLLGQIPPCRYIDALKYAHMSRKAKNLQNTGLQKKYFDEMKNEKEDLALLKIFETFTEAAPQQVIAVCYFFSRETLIQQGQWSDVVKIVMGLYSFGVMAYYLLCYQTDIRSARDGTNNMKFLASLFFFLWQLCISVSRIFVVSALFLTVGAWTFIACFVHWFLMTAAISYFDNHRGGWSLISISEHEYRKDNSCMKSTQKFSEKFNNFLVSAGLGLVYIFVYITSGDGRTLYRHTYYFSFCLVENIIVAFLWNNSVYEGSAHPTIIFLMCFVPYILGIAFMIVYYLMFHPTRGPMCSLHKCN